MSIDRTKCYCDEAESYIREQLELADFGDIERLDIPPELTHVPAVVDLSDQRRARLKAYEFGGGRAWAEYEVIPR